MRVSSDFKTHRFFKYNIYIRTTNLKHSVQRKLNTNMCVHTYISLPICVITAQMKKEHFQHARGIPHALS